MKYSAEQITKLMGRFATKKRFATRGTTFAKKMWRDGYNKCLDDFRVWMTEAMRYMEEEKT